MSELGLEHDTDRGGAYRRAVQRFREARIVLPTFAQLAEPHRIPSGIRGALARVGPDAPHPANLFRVHWHNDASRRGVTDVPEHVVLPPAFTGVAAPILVALGDRFPMIRAHKVLAAYACLAPRIVSGQFDPTSQRAVWPSTGNFCRGGVAISRIMGCRGLAVLPQGMSAERFRWLERWVTEPADIIRTPGGEPDVRWIFEACRELARDPANVVFDQFSEYGNHLAHWRVTGPALERIFEAERAARGSLTLAAFVSASGSAGTLGAGDYLKERHDARIVAAEALECPTLLENGYGDHNIQGIGDRHVPLIHNVMNTDIVVAVSDRATDDLEMMADTPAAREYLQRRRVPDLVIEALPSFGLSSWCNVIAAIRVAKRLGLGPDQAIVTVATDGAEMYASEREKVKARRFPGGFMTADAEATFGQHVLDGDDEHVLELDDHERRRIFNLGYYTWVEQLGVPLAEFDARRSQEFWVGLRSRLAGWDDRIVEFNERVGLLGES